MAIALPQTVHPPQLDKDIFMRSVLRELAGVLEQTIGEREAAAYVNHVGLALGRMLNDQYRAAFEQKQLTSRQVAATLVDLKARIDGGFSIESIDQEKIVLVNSACPFGDKVVGRPSLCRMTVNVFGHITAENMGYARVHVDEAIARGDPRCRVTVYFSEPAGAVDPRDGEFFGADG